MQLWILDTSADIRDVFDDYVSSDNDDFTLDGDFAGVRQNTEDNDVNDFDGDPCKAVPEWSPLCFPASDESSPGQVPGSPTQPLLAAIMPKRDNWLAPPPVAEADPTKIGWTDLDEDETFVPHDYVFNDANWGDSQAVRDLPQNTSCLVYFELLCDAELMDIFTNVMLEKYRYLWNECLSSHRFANTNGEKTCDQGILAQGLPNVFTGV